MTKKILKRFEIKNKIKRWINKVAKKTDAPEIKESYKFENDHYYKGDFAFYYDGILADLIYHGAIYINGYKLFKNLGQEFDNLFEGNNWAGDFIEHSVMHIFKE